MRETLNHFLKSFLILLMVTLGCGVMNGTTTTVSIENYASAHSWVNETKYLSVTIDGNVTAAASGSTNTGKYYTTDHSWRFYANESGTLTLSTTSGEFSSVTLTFSIKDNGKISYSGSPLTSGTAVSVSGSSISFIVGQTSGTKGKVFVTSISVTYSGDSSHTITYKPNGTTGSDRTQTSSESSVVLYNNTYTRSGYIFDNWNTKADGTGNNYDEGSTYTLSSDVTLYAKWLKDVYVQEFGGSCNVFSENWSETASTGGNDGQWNGSIAPSASTIVCDKTGWTFTSEHGASSCIRLGTGSVKGSAETPEISYIGQQSLKLVFKAGAWDYKDEKTTLKVSATNATVSMSEVELSKGEWTVYTLSLTNVTNNFKVKWEAKDTKNNRFFLDSICISSSETPIDVVSWYKDSIFLSKDYFKEINFSAEKIRIKPIQGKVSLANMADSTLKASVDLSSSYCDTLHFIVCNDTTALEQRIKIPYIISSSTNIPDIDDDCDVVISPKAVLTINTDSENKDVYVYPTGALSIPSGKTYTVNSLTLRRDNDSVPHLSYNGTLDIKNGLFFEMRTDGSDWRWLTLPDTFRTKDVNANSKTGGVYDYGVLIKHYDGQYRADNGRGGWKLTEPDSAFAPGVGCIFGLYTDNDAKQIHRIELDTAVLKNEKSNKSVQVYAYTSNTGKPDNDLGWNVVGNPYFDTYHAGLSNPIKVGHLIKDNSTTPWNGKWIIDEDDVESELRYIVIKSEETEDEIAAGGYKSICITTDGYDLKPFTSFFIQASGDALLTFDKSNKISRAPSRQSINDINETFLRVKVGDRQTGCFISNKFTDEYEIGDDLESMYPIYQLINGYKLLYSAVNDSIINNGITVYTPSGTLRLDEKVNTNDFEEIYALYDGGWYDLLHGETVDVSDSFILYARRKENNNVATDISNVTNNVTTRKVIYQGNLYIIKNNCIFNALGEKIIRQ